MLSILVRASTLPECIQFSIYEFASGDREYRRNKVLHQFAFNRVLEQMYFRLMHKRAMEHNGIRLDTLLTQMKVFGAINSFEYPSTIPGQIYMNKCGTPVFPTNQSAMEFNIRWGKGLDANSIIVFRFDINRGSTFTMISYGTSVSKSNTYCVHTEFATLVAYLINL